MFVFQPRGFVFKPCVCASIFTSIRKHNFLTFFGSMRLHPLFRLCRTFFKKIFNVPKVSSLQFISYFPTTNVRESQRVSFFRFFGTMRLLKFSFFVFRKFFERLQTVSLQFFEILQQNGCLKISKGPPLQFSALWDFSKGIIFVLKLGFLRPSTLYPIFVFFKRPVFFLCGFFKFYFHRSPPQFSQETKLFTRVKESSTFSALCDLPETFFKKIFENFRNFFLIFVSWKIFRWEWWFFCCFQLGLGKNGFRDLCVSLRVLFGAVKFMKF